jgi:hypothetical protein
VKKRTFVFKQRPADDEDANTQKDALAGLFHPELLRKGLTGTAIVIAVEAVRVSGSFRSEKGLRLRLCCEVSAIAVEEYVPGCQPCWQSEPDQPSDGATDQRQQ